jgi:hypothetical protein
MQVEKVAFPSHEVEKVVLIVLPTEERTYRVETKEGKLPQFAYIGALFEYEYTSKSAEYGSIDKFVEVNGKQEFYRQVVIAT